MFDHSDSIKDILQSAKEELKKSPEFKKTQIGSNPTSKKPTNKESVLVLKDTAKNHIKEIQKNILTLNHEVQNIQDLLVLKNEAPITEQPNILYLKQEYKPDFQSVLTLNYEIDFNEPLILSKEIESSAHDLESELSALDLNVDAEDPIYNKVDYIEQKQTDIKNKLDNIYEKLEDDSTNTEVKIDLLSKNLDEKIYENISNINQTIEYLKDSLRADEINQSIQDNNEALKNNLELTLSAKLDPTIEKVQVLQENFYQVNESIVESNEGLKQSFFETNEILKHDILESNENIKSEIIDNIRSLEDERIRLEEERIARENGPQEKLEKRFKEVSDILEAQNLKMQNFYNSMEMRHNQNMIQNVISNFMNNIQNYEKKFEEKINSINPQNFTTQVTPIQQPLDQDRLQETIVNFERRMDEKIRNLQNNNNIPSNISINIPPNTNAPISTNQPNQIQNDQTQVDNNQNDFMAKLEEKLDEKIQSLQSHQENPKLDISQIQSINESIDLFKSSIDKKFLAFDDMVRDLNVFTRDIKDQLPSVEGISTDIIAQLKQSINSSIQTELNRINDKLIKFDDWMNLLKDKSTLDIDLEAYKDLEKFKTIEEARAFITNEIISNTQKWLLKNKNKIDELAKILLS